MNHETSHYQHLASQLVEAPPFVPPTGDYWQGMATMYGETGDDRARRLSEANGRDLEALNQAIRKPQPVAVNGRKVRASEVPEEWYLKLGTFNELQDDSTNLGIGFVRLWESARQSEHFSDNIDQAYKQAVGQIAMVNPREGIVSQAIQDFANEPKRAARAILAGNALIDRGRRLSPSDRLPADTASLRLASRLNSGLVISLEQVDNPSADEKRLISDALKFKYEAEFELITTDWQTDRCSEDEYQLRFNHLLNQQLAETTKLAQTDKLINGDLFEHYAVALLRYGMTGWRDETRYVVQAATRRQDEPHDGFVKMHLPANSFDAVIRDLNGEKPTEYIQLKLSRNLGGRYAENIRMVSNLTADESNVADREEILEGIGQMRGLLHELNTGLPYPHDIDTVSRHIQTLLSDLPELTAYQALSSDNVVQRM
jgi:predicted transcriptional regulator